LARASAFDLDAQDVLTYTMRRWLTVALPSSANLTATILRSGTTPSRQNTLCHCRNSCRSEKIGGAIFSSGKQPPCNITNRPPTASLTMAGHLKACEFSDRRRGRCVIDICHLADASALPTG